MIRDWGGLAARVVDGDPLKRAEALDLLQAPDDEHLAILDAAFRVRQRFYGRAVNLHVLNNAKSGLCSETCAFCSQSAVSESPIPRYSIKTPEDLERGADRAVELGAVKYCMVISSRSPSTGEMAVLCEALRRIRARHRIGLCCSVGLLNDAQARALKDAGADRINHNLETSRRFFPEICTTHTYEDRVRTIRTALRAGLEICSGGLLGMGETLEDRVELAFALRDLGVHSIPVNFFNPRPGTELASVEPLCPVDALKALCMFRLANPERDLRAAGGREAVLRHLQVFSLYVANSIFTEGYLTTPGQGRHSDLQMIEDAGFEVARIEA